MGFLVVWTFVTLLTVTQARLFNVKSKPVAMLGIDWGESLKAQQ